MLLQAIGATNSIWGRKCQYVPLHAIKESYTHDYQNLATTNTFADMPLSNAYRTFYSYDLNGNIVCLNRRNGEGPESFRDSIVWGYNYLQVSDVSNGKVDNYKLPSILLDLIFNIVGAPFPTAP